MATYSSSNTSDRIGGYQVPYSDLFKNPPQAKATTPRPSVQEAVIIFCRMIGCDEDMVIGFTAEPGRIVVCMFLPDPENPSEKLMDDKGIPVVGDYAADFGPNSAIAFVEGSERPITDLIEHLPSNATTG